MALRKYDFTGQVFGRLTALGYSSGRWLCSCTCGASPQVDTSSLRSGRVQSCGCLQKELAAAKNRLDIALGSEIDVGYGKLTVLKEVAQQGQFRMFEFRCYCGNTFVARLNGVRTGNTKSCGCLLRSHPNNKTHGMTNTLTYKRWKVMLTRATNPNIANAKNYSERGISVCDRWRQFENFLYDMGEVPSPELTLDRKDNDKGYCKDNCQWVTQSEQMRNTKRDGVPKNIRQLPSGRWRVMIGAGFKNKHVGVYDTYELACQAKLEAENLYWNSERNGNEKATEDSERTTCSCAVCKAISRVG